MRSLGTLDHPDCVIDHVHVTLACSEGATGAASRSINDATLETTVHQTWKYETLVVKMELAKCLGFTRAICCVFRLSKHFISFYRADDFI